LEHGYLLLELSGMSTGLDNTFLECAYIVVNRRAVVAALSGGEVPYRACCVVEQAEPRVV
jgi:hypothetical protein